MNKKSPVLIAILAISLMVTTVVNAAPLQPAAWNDPVIIYEDVWPDTMRFDVNDAADRLVALVPSSGSNKYTRDIIATEKVGGAWQTPVAIAHNGLFSDESFQWLPQVTHPVLSGDGSTIAYVGWTGASDGSSGTNGAFIIDRQPDGSWGAPVLVNSFANTHYWISLSADGNALALCDYPLWDMQKLYVMTRSGGVWGTPVLIGEGGDPNLSEDGTQVVFIYNANLSYSQLDNGTWSAPVQLTSYPNDQFSVEYPQISADGQSLYYWVVTLVPDGTSLVRTEESLYVMRREGAAWGEPQKVNSDPVIPSGPTDGPAAADAHATRFIYTVPVRVYVPEGNYYLITSSNLKISEEVDGTWQESILVEQNAMMNYNQWPKLTPNGQTLTFDAGFNRNTPGGLVYYTLWQVTTPDAPPPPVVNIIIPPTGGTLISDLDGITYVFPPGAFQQDVRISHRQLSQPPGPPPPLLEPFGSGFSVTARYIASGLPAQPSLPVNFTLTYDPANTGAAIPGTLALWRLDGSTWAKVGGTDDGQGTLSAELTHFSDYAVFGDTRHIFLPAILH